MTRGLTRALVVCRLLPGAVKLRLQPLATLPEVESLTVVRATPGPPMPKVEYLCPPRWVGWRGLAVLVEAWIAVRAARRLRPDFVHGIYLVPHGLTAILAARLARCPAVVAIIGTDLHGHLETGRKPWRRFLMACLRRARGVFSTGPLSARRLVELGLEEGRVRVLPNGVDLERFATPAGAAAPERALDLLFVGRMVEGKRPLLFIDLVQRLRELRGGPVRAALLGDGPQLPTVRARLRELDLHGAVEAPGHVSDVPGWLARSRLMVLPTVAEGLPYAVLEAMAAGVPPVVSAVGDLPAVLRDGETGLLVRSFEDVEATAARIHSLLADRDRRARMAASARGVARDAYGVEAARKAWREMLAAVET